MNCLDAWDLAYLGFYVKHCSCINALDRDYADVREEFVLLLNRLKIQRCVRMAKSMKDEGGLVRVCAVE